MILRIIVTVLVFAVVSGCSYRKEVLDDDCSSTNSSFNNVVLPILQNSCAVGSSCHGQGSFNGPGPLMNYAAAKAASIQIRDAVRSGRMPQGSVLPASQKQAIICWVDAGSPNN